MTLRQCQPMQSPIPTHERRRRTDRRSDGLHPLAGELASAIGRGEVDVLFQPQFSCADGSVTGAGALVRWYHPLRGGIGGDQLFGIAARSGLARQLSRYVLAKALAAASAWPEHMRLSFNITPADLSASDFTDSVSAALARSAFAPERLTLELTEQALVHDLDGSAERLHMLVDLGIRVALDDFGAGFCNFRYLKKLPLHYIKLDRSMVEGIGHDSRDLEVLRGIVAMANALDLAVIAEGIEMNSQLEAVKREGCASWQGFLGARPLEAARLAELAKA